MESPFEGPMLVRVQDAQDRIRNASFIRSTRGFRSVARVDCAYPRSSFQNLEFSKTKREAPRLFFRFLALPPETRNAIYDFIFGDVWCQWAWGHCFKGWDQKFSPGPMALIYVCKQIHAEAFDAMHKSLRFVCFTNVTKVKNFPTVLPSMRPPCLQVQLIKDLTLHIFLTAQAIEAMYGSSSVPQTTFPHLSAFESLKVLRLCVGSDYGSIFFGRSHNAPGLQTPMILVRVKNLLSVLVGATPSGVRLVPLEEHEYPLFHPTGGCYMSTALLCGALAELRRDWALSRLARAPNNEKKALEKECKEASEALRMMEEEWKKIKAERARVEAELEIEAELEMKALEKELKQANEALRMTEDESKNVKAERARVEADLALKRGVSGPTVIDLTGGGD